MILFARTRALQEQYALGLLAIRGPHNLTLCRHLLQLDVCDHVRQSVSERSQFGRIVGLPASCHDDCARAMNRRFSRSLDGDVEHSGLAFRLQYLARAENFQSTLSVVNSVVGSLGLTSIASEFVPDLTRLETLKLNLV